MLMVLLPICAFAQHGKGVHWTNTAWMSGINFMTGAEVLPKGRVQLETSMGCERLKIEEPATSVWSLNASLLRWGIFDRAELRLQGECIYTYSDGSGACDLTNVAVGAKVNLFEGWKAVPAVSLLCNVLVPGGSKAENLPRHWGGQMGVLFQNELATWCTLNYEADLIWSDSEIPAFFLGASLGFQVTDRLSLAAGEFNLHTPDGHEPWLELGAACQLAPRLQADLVADIDLCYPQRHYNLALGVVWQIVH